MIELIKKLAATTPWLNRDHNKRYNIRLNGRQVTVAWVDMSTPEEVWHVKNKPQLLWRLLEAEGTDCEAALEKRLGEHLESMDDEHMRTEE